MSSRSRSRPPSDSLASSVTCSNASDAESAWTVLIDPDVRSLRSGHSRDIVECSAVAHLVQQDAVRSHSEAGLQQILRPVLARP